MSYIPLAVKYRPQQFSDFIGQQGTLKALTNGIALGREPRCLIFSGIRGVGKTTLARLYAMALNCEHPENGEPCGKCGNCTSIQAGTHENVTEIDGASNTSVEDIRNLQETMTYVPQRGRFKVYIVDEVHMLSNSAFNAFLKTLEEPPADVIFILATTELDKIPKTVQSRCQTFFLAKMSPEEIKRNLERILSAEGISYEPEALQLVALEGQGSMRDALTFLDQVIAMSSGELTEELLAQLSQNLPFSACLSFLEAMMAKDGQGLIAITDSWHNKGIDYRKTTAELVRILRNAMIVAGIGDSDVSRKAMALSDGEWEATRKLSAAGGPMDCNRMFRALVSLYHQLDGSFLDRYLMENVGLEWCFDPGIVPAGASTAPRTATPGTAAPQSTPQGSSLGSASRGGSSQSAPHPGGPVGAAPRTPLSAAAFKAEALSEPVSEPMPKPVSEPSPPPPADAVERAGASGSASKRGLSAAFSEMISEPAPEARPKTTRPAPQPAPPQESASALAPPPFAAEPPPPAFTPEPPPQEPPPPAFTPEPPPQELAPQAAPEPQAAPPPPQEAPQAEPAPVPSQEPASQSSQASTSGEFPATWREFVTRWAKAKPFLARIVEEAHVVAYGPELIHLAVDPSSMAGSKLLSTDKQQAFRADFTALFGFGGRLEVMTLADYKADQPDQPLEATLLEVKVEENQRKHAELVDSAKNHPLTRSALEVFGGKIESIDIVDQHR